MLDIKLKCFKIATMYSTN